VFTRPLDINNRGQIVGDYGTKPPATASSPSSDAADWLAGSGLPDPLGMSLSEAPG
jgi:hypothetical protein